MQGTDGEKVPQTENEARELFRKMQKRSDDVQQTFRLNGSIQSSMWLNFVPVLVDSLSHGEPVGLRNENLVNVQMQHAFNAAQTNLKGSS